MVRLVDEQDVTRAIENPPEDTRAYFRGRCLQQYPEAVAAASWDSVIFDIPGHESLQRVPTLEPLRGTRATSAACWIAAGRPLSWSPPSPGRADRSRTAGGRSMDG